MIMKWFIQISNGHVTDRLSAYVENELMERERQLVETHLKDCRRCAKNFVLIRDGIRLAKYIKVVPAPDSIWQGLEQRLRSPSVSAKYEKLRPKLAVPLSALIIGVALFLAYLQNQRQDTLYFDLDGYLTIADSMDTPRSEFDKILRWREEFKETTLNEVLNVAGVRESAKELPNGYRLTIHGVGAINGSKMAQLVYRDDSGNAFAVIVAPRSVKFDFGDREVVPTQLGAISCDRIDCPRLTTFWFREGDYNCVIVGKIEDEQSIEPAVRYFVMEHSKGRS